MEASLRRLYHHCLPRRRDAVPESRERGASRTPAGRLGRRARARRGGRLRAAAAANRSRSLVGFTRARTGRNKSLSPRRRRPLARAPPPPPPAARRRARAPAAAGRRARPRARRPHTRARAPASARAPRQELVLVHLVRLLDDPQRVGEAEELVDDDDLRRRGAGRRGRLRERAAAIALVAAIKSRHNDQESQR
jgi:hypothetical protein